jgi:hypothetical protein
VIRWLHASRPAGGLEHARTGKAGTALTGRDRADSSGGSCAQRLVDLSYFVRRNMHEHQSSSINIVLHAEGVLQSSSPEQDSHVGEVHSPSRLFTAFVRTRR